MYTGSNPSALRSREWIRSALIKLLKHKKYVQITVKDLCKKADLSRQTFYQIFESKEEVMEYHFMILFEKFTKECGDFSKISLSELVYQFFHFFYEQKEFINVLIENNMTYLLEQQFEIYLCKIDFFKKINDTERYPDYTLAYVAGALTQILIHWFNKKFDLSVQEIADMTEETIIGVKFENEGGQICEKSLV